MQPGRNTINNGEIIGNSGRAEERAAAGRRRAGKTSPPGRGISGNGCGRAAGPADKDVRGGGRPRPRICVIDPDLELAKDLESVFGAMGCDVLALGCVIGASNRIRAFAPDLLIVDTMMPSVSGRRLIEVLRLNLSELPLMILYSSLAERDLAGMARDVKADDFIVKNGDLLPLLNRVKFHLNLLRPRKGPGVAAADDPVRPRLYKGRGQ